MRQMRNGSKHGVVLFGRHAQQVAARRLPGIFPELHGTIADVCNRRGNRFGAHEKIGVGVVHSGHFSARDGVNGRVVDELFLERTASALDHNPRTEPTSVTSVSSLRKGSICAMTFSMARTGTATSTASAP